MKQDSRGRRQFPGGEGLRRAGYLKMVKRIESRTETKLPVSSVIRLLISNTHLTACALATLFPIHPLHCKANAICTRSRMRCFMTTKVMKPRKVVFEFGEIFYCLNNHHRTKDSLLTPTFRATFFRR